MLLVIVATTTALTIMTASIGTSAHAAVINTHCVPFVCPKESLSSFPTSFDNANSANSQEHFQHK
jgi:hypothetical protein